jgi:hypothetical protein
LAQRMIEHWGFQTLWQYWSRRCLRNWVKYGDMYSKITIASPDKDLFRLPILGSMIIVKELLYFVTRLCRFINFVIN